MISKRSHINHIKNYSKFHVFTITIYLFQQVNEKLETIKHTIAKKERTIPDVRAQVRHLKSQYDEITELRDMGKKVSQLKDELIWSKVSLRTLSSQRHFQKKYEIFFTE